MSDENQARECIQGEPAQVRLDWPDPTQAQLDSPAFAAVWQCIKRWDINVPDVYTGYCGATGNHVRAILDALGGVTVPVELHQVDLRPDPQSVLVVRVPLHMIDEATFDRILEDVHGLRPQGDEWRGLQIPVFIMTSDSSIEQLDKEKMRALGWVRVEEQQT
jgi:hypothetical protein